MALSLRKLGSSFGAKKTVNDGDRAEQYAAELAITNRRAEIEA